MKKVRRKLRPTEIGVIKTFSLSPDDEVGEIAVQCSGCTYYYDNLRELCEGWEDYEEPKVYYYISDFGAVRECEIGKFPEDEEDRKAIGNYFETEEEAEEAVEKLKARKRLKDEGLHVTTYYVEDGFLGIRATTCNSSVAENWEDIDSLLGGEE